MLALGVQDLLVFLLASGLIVPAARRLRVNPVLGFLAVGTVVGPYGLTRLVPEGSWLGHLSITNVSAAHALAELGVVFLLFMIALELPLARLLAMRRLVFGMGFLQVALTTLVIGGVALAFGNTLSAALLIGGALALSSTAIVSQHLLEERRMSTVVGKASFGVLLAQDLAVVPMLFLVGTIAAQNAAVVGAAGGAGQIGLALPLLLALGKAALSIGAIVLIGRFVIRRLFQLVTVGHSSEVFMATTLLVITLIAWLTHAAGMSAALGAFLAGLILAETEYRHEIELIIEPLKGLLLGLFFLSVGMNIDLAEVAANPMWIALSVFGLMLLKAVLAAIVARLFGHTTAESVETGMLLGQGGEFAFVIVTGAVVAGLINQPIAQFMLIVVSATMVLTPGAIRLAGIVGAALAPKPSLLDVPDRLTGSSQSTGSQSVAEDEVGHVILVGFGRTGRLLGELLQSAGKPWLALDLDPVTVATEQGIGAPLYLGDASRAAMLTKVQISQAAAVVICTDDQRFSERILRCARSLDSTVPVLVRVHGSEEGATFINAGASVAVPEVLESGLQLAVSLFNILGVAESSYAPLLAEHRSPEGLRQV